MNLTRSRHISKTCTCNSCVFKSKGEVIVSGSRIDRLYHDKYLPLRERKLLDKLVRTRGVYDDIRNRILSLSSVDITKNRESEDSQSLLSETDSETNSAVHKLVDLVDRGEYPSLNSSVHLHSDCCGCCICSSKTRIQKHKVHMHIPEKEHIRRYVETHKMRKYSRKVGFRTARSDPCLCTLKFSISPKNHKKVVKKIRSKDKDKPININKCECRIEAVKPSLSKKSIVLLKNVENKVRDSIRSTVTKIENVFHIKKDSLMIFRDKLKANQAIKSWKCDPDFCIPDDCNPDECFEKVKRREAKMDLKAHHNIPKKYRARKVKQTQIPPEQKDENKGPKGSLTGHELKRCFCTQELQKPQVKQERPQSKKRKKEVKVKKTPKAIITKTICKCEVKDSVSQTKKESFAKPHKIEIQTAPLVQRKPHDLLPYECEPLFCIPGECKPIVCEERIKLRYFKNKAISKDTLEIPQMATMITRRKRTPKSNHDTPIAEKSNSAPNAPRKQAVRISSSFRFDIEFFKEKNFPEALDINTGHNKYRDIEAYSEQTKYKPSSEVKINHINKEEKSFSNTPSLPSGKSQEQNLQDAFLKRCFCTLKLHKTPKQKPKPKRPKSKMTMTTDKAKGMIEQVKCKCKNMNIDCICESDNTSNKSQASMTTSNLLPYECEPLFCIPGECNPKICEKHIMKRYSKKPKTVTKEINTELKKSTKTITPQPAKSYSVRHIPVTKRKKTKMEEIEEPYRTPLVHEPKFKFLQGVKISSNFSFDIEFYKDKVDDTTTIQKEEYLPSQDTKELKKKEQQKSVEYTQPPKIQEPQALKRIQSLKKCLCSIKLNKKPKMKLNKAISKKTTTTNSKPVSYICECKNISTQTKKIKVKPPIPQRPGLLPYECEPNFCIPGKCDPLICNERIKMRNKKEEEKEPLLKRCFCTLKFHNDVNAKGKCSVTPLQDDLKLTNLKSIGTDTNKVKHQKKGKYKLLPYECEPGICEPGKCDPIECLKIIKKRNLPEVKQQTKQANTEAPKIKSEYSETKPVSKIKKAQLTEIILPKNEVIKTERRVTPTNKSRDSVKLSSEFNFDIEFFKNKRDARDGKRKVKIKPKIGMKLTKGSTREEQSKNSAAQVSYPKEDKTKLKRCFCTLKLNKKGQNVKPLHQQVYYVGDNVSAGFLRETNVGPRECTPCLCIARRLQEL